jgi:hypothetical protein
LIYSRDNFLDEVKERKREEKCKEDFLSPEEKETFSNLVGSKITPKK